MRRAPTVVLALATVVALTEIARPGSALAQAAVAPLAGEWVGSWGRDADTLAVAMRFEERDGVWSGAFDAERLRVEGIPLTSVEVDGAAVRMRMVGDATTIVFTGSVADDTLSGTFDESGAPGWFELTKAAAAPPALKEEEVRFSNGGVELAGTLVLPNGEGPHRAVVFLHGSGAEGRWASRYLARRLARDGTAALIWDKRGVGESTGWWPEADFDDLAADAAAAVAFLRTRPEIDPARVGIHGHSQGGTIAPLVAVRSGADFVIASAASGLPMDEVEIYSVGNAIGISSLPPAEAALARAYVEALVDVAYHGAPRDSLDGIVERARGHGWFFEPPAPDEPYWWFSRRIAGYEPLRWWRQVRVPVLLVYGGADERVPAESSRAAIEAVVREAGGEIGTRMFEGADHTFRIRRPDDVWPRTAPGYPDAIVEWLRAR